MVAAMKDIQQKNFDNFESQLAWMNTSFVYGNLEAEVRFRLRNQKKKKNETKRKQECIHSIAKVKIVKYELYKCEHTESFSNFSKKQKKQTNNKENVKIYDTTLPDTSN